MKLSWLNLSIDALSKKRGLYRFCNSIKEDRRQNMLMTYAITSWKWFILDTSQ